MSGEKSSKIYVLFLKYVREPVGVFDSDKALQEGIDEIKAKWKIKGANSFIIKEFELNVPFGEVFKEGE